MTNRSTWVVAVVIASIAGSTILVSSQVGLGDAEALYYCYGQHVQLSYLDHPPMLGWLIHLSTRLLGTSVFAVRLVPLLCAPLAILGTYLLTRDLFGSVAAAWSVLLLFATPIFSAGLTAATPDAPAAAIWPWCTWLLIRLVNANNGRRFGYRVGILALLGGLVGVGLLCKYTSGCLVISVLLVLLSYRLGPGKVWGLILGSAIFAATVSPIFLWNMEHDWASVQHRLVWSQNHAGLSLRNTGALVGGQLLYLGPLTLLLFVLAAKWIWSTRATHPERLVLLWTAGPTLFLTYLLALWSKVAEPHWPALGYLSLYPAAGGLIAAGQRTRMVIKIAKIALGYGIVALCALHLAVLTPALPSFLPTEQYRPKYDLTNELYGWSELASVIRKHNAAKRPVLAGFYTQCSQLSFALWRTEDPEVRCLSAEVDDFDFWHTSFSLPAQGALWVTDNRFEHNPLQLLPSARLVGKPLTVEYKRGGRWVRRFSIYQLMPQSHEGHR